MKRLYCPQYLTVHSRSESSSSSSSSPSLSLSDTGTVTVAECAGRVSTFNTSELSSADPSGVFNDEGNVFSARGRTPSHQRASFLATSLVLPIPTCKNHLGRGRTRRSHCSSHNCQGSLPLDVFPSSRAPSANLSLPLPPLIFDRVVPFKDAAPHVRLCGKFTAQPHVRCTYGKRAVWIFFWEFFFSKKRRLENSSVGQKNTHNRTYGTRAVNVRCGFFFGDFFF